MFRPYRRSFLTRFNWGEKKIKREDNHTNSLMVPMDHRMRKGYAAAKTKTGDLSDFRSGRCVSLDYSSSYCITHLTAKNYYEGECDCCGDGVIVHMGTPSSLLSR